jgi:hypothetical protein
MRFEAGAVGSTDCRYLIDKFSCFVTVITIFLLTSGAVALIRSHMYETATSPLPLQEACGTPRTLIVLRSFLLILQLVATKQRFSGFHADIHRQRVT